MAMKKVLPGPAGFALTGLEVFRERPNLIHAHLPSTTPAQKRWLHAISEARQLGEPFIEWASKHATAAGGTIAEVIALISDIRDWVLASYRSSVPHHVAMALGGPFERGKGSQFVTRQFSPDMSMGTVLALSNEWHEAVAEGGEMEGGSFDFATPWFADGESNGYQIKAITNNADLYREGKEMHHCVGTYSGDVRQGGRYIYSVRKDEKKVATLELGRGDDNKIHLGQIRCKQNKRVPPDIEKAVRKWFRSRKRIQGDVAPAIKRPEPAPHGFPEGWLEANAFTVPANLDDELPF